MKFFKNGKYKICIVLLVAMLIMCCASNIYAAINTDGAGAVSQ